MFKSFLSRHLHTRAMDTGSELSFLSRYWNLMVMDSTALVDPVIERPSEDPSKGGLFSGPIKQSDCPMGFRCTFSSVMNPNCSFFLLTSIRSADIVASCSAIVVCRSSTLTFKPWTWKKGLYRLVLEYKPNRNKLNRPDKIHSSWPMLDSNTVRVSLPACSRIDEDIQNNLRFKMIYDLKHYPLMLHEEYRSLTISFITF